MLRMPLGIKIGPQKSTPVLAKGRSILTLSLRSGAMNGVARDGIERKQTMQFLAVCFAIIWPIAKVNVGQQFSRANVNQTLVFIFKD